MMSDTATLQSQTLHASSQFRSTGLDGNSIVTSRNGTSLTYVDGESTGAPVSAPAREPEASPSTTSTTPHNRRIMHDLLALASPLDLSTAKPIDTTSVGALVDSFPYSAFASAIASHPNFTTTLNSAPPFNPSALRRITKELQHTPLYPAYIHLQPLGPSLRHLHASIEGPPSSPYTGGLFHLILSLPSTYPLHPPHCTFATKIYHPNISPSGEICLDILQKDWSPVQNFESILISISSMLDDPGLEDPLVPEIAEVYVRERGRGRYEENARGYTERYASEFGVMEGLVGRCVGICEAEEGRRADS